MTENSLLKGESLFAVKSETIVPFCKKERFDFDWFPSAENPTLMCLPARGRAGCRPWNPSSSLLRQHSGSGWPTGQAGTRYSAVFLSSYQCSGGLCCGSWFSMRIRIQVFIPMHRSGSREPNQCGSRSGSWSDF